MRNIHRSKKKDYLYTGRITQSMEGRTIKLKSLVPLVIDKNNISIFGCNFKKIKNLTIKNKSNVDIIKSNFICEFKVNSGYLFNVNNVDNSNICYCNFVNKYKK